MKINKHKTYAGREVTKETRKMSILNVPKYECHQLSLFTAQSNEQNI